MSLEPEWDINLRGNLRLWPQPVPNIQALVACVGRVYDERGFLEEFPRGSGKAPTDTRAVRNTFEILSNAGLMYRERGSDELLLTALGHSLFSFLGVNEERRFANESNLHLIGLHFIRALSTIIECRLIWMLMRKTHNLLSNEELNRSMNVISSSDDIEAVAASVIASRETGDVRIIGDRIYQPEAYGTAQEADQRKAINPHFLLAGGGGIFIEVGAGGMRSFTSWALPLIDISLEDGLILGHATTAEEVVNRMSDYSGVPLDLR